MGLTTTNIWAEILSDDKHDHHKLIYEQIKNDSQQIGSIKPERNLIFANQAHWIKHANFIVIYDNLRTEWELLMKYLNYEMVFPELEIEKREYKYSSKALKYLENIYSDDIEIYKKYKNISINKRLLINK